MEVTVKLLSTFRKYGDHLPNGKAKLKEGSSVQDLVMEIGLPPKYVRLVFVNGRQVNLQTMLSHEDTVVFLPPAIGGG